MRKLIALEFLSVDGLIAGPAGRELDWVREQFTSAINRDIVMQYEAVGSFLLGRTTYESMADYWPDANPEKEPRAHAMNRTEKLVFSRTLTAAPWNNCKLIADDVVETVERLKAGRGQDLMILGSARLVQALTKAALIDEYRFYLFPVVLGKGKALFKGVDGRHDLQLLRSYTFSNGVIKLEYRQLPE
jgi:dihydrofolate reductase